MMNLPNRPPLLARQRGAASIGIAMLVVFILAAAVVGVLKISSSSVFDSAKNEEQVSSLFLAESGLERALATLRSAALNNTYTDATCTGLIGQTANLGRGSFTYTGATSTPTTCSGGNCTQCLVTVTGSIGATSSRTIQGQLTATQQNGTTGQTNTSCPTANCTPDVVMNMTVANPNSFAFVHLLFNSTTNWGGNPVTPSCVDTGTGSLSNCTLAWNLTGNYYNNPVTIGVYAPMTNAGKYSLTEKVLSNLPTTDSRNNYAAVGAIFSSSGGGAPGYVGSFAKSPATTGTFPNKHVACPIATTSPRTMPLVAGDCNPYDYQHAYLDSGWTCNGPINNTTPNWSNAGQADTLLAGFGGKPYSPGSNSRCGNVDGVNYYDSATGRCTNQLNAMEVNGQPLYKQLSLDGQQGDYMYSQLWWTYNPAYDAITTTATASNQTPVASFTGAIGAQFTGAISNRATVTGSIGAIVTGSISGTTMTVTNVGSGVLHVGDVLSSDANGPDVRNNTTINAFGTGSGGTGTYEVSGNPQTVTSRTVTAINPTSVLTVTNISAGNNGGELRLGDTLFSTGSGTNVSAGTTITALGSGSGGLGTYIVSGAQNVSSRTFTAASNILRVSSVTSGSLAAGNFISSGIAGKLIIQPFATQGTTGAGSMGDYVLSGQVAPVSYGDPVAMQAANYSSTITLSGGSVPATPPAVGTALGITNGAFTGCIGNTTSCSGSTANCSNSGTTLRVCTAPGGVPLKVGDVLYGANIAANTTITALGTGTGGVGTYIVNTSQSAARGTIFMDFFLPDSVTASISGATLTVSAAASGANLSVGDALFGNGIKPLTRITARVTGTGGTGTYSITPNGQTVSSGPIMARPAVVSAASANSFTMSRLPSSNFDDARLCGGLCPMLMGDGVRTVGQVDLSNIVDYDDWSSGFACVKGINPDNIKTVVNVMSKQGQWTELVK